LEDSAGLEDLEADKRRIEVIVITVLMVTLSIAGIEDGIVLPMYVGTTL
jgi:hypothetical protein